MMNKVAQDCTVIDPATGEAFSYAQLRQEWDIAFQARGSHRGRIVLPNPQRWEGLKRLYLSWPSGHFVTCTHTGHPGNISPDKIEWAWKKASSPKPIAL